MATRITFLIQLTTNPADRAAAAPHSAGWSESWWGAGVSLLSDPLINALATKRAALLPKEGTIVGKRASIYTIVGNKLAPSGSTTAKLNMPGATARICGVPQKALEFAGTTLEGPNASRFALRGIPDDQFTGGEYQPTSAYKALVTAFSNELCANGWNFLGRDLAQPSVKVNSINGNVVTLNDNVGVVPGTGYIRFKRVYDDDHEPVIGSYLVTAVAGKAYTLAGFPGRVLTTPSGTVRVDQIRLFDFESAIPVRAVVRKVGRPFASYRGRQSKR